jgi:integrase
MRQQIAFFPLGGGMKGVELYGRVRHAVQIEGLSRREAGRRFGIDPRTVAKMLVFSVPPGYRRGVAAKRPKLDPFTAIIDQLLEADRTAHSKQHHTSKRIFERLRDEYVLRDDLFKVMSGMGETLRDVRDRALWIIGFAGGFRRSELVGLDSGDIEYVRQGVIINIRRSKTDQFGAGRRIGLMARRSIVR